MTDLFIAQDKMVLDYMNNKYSRFKDTFEIVNAQRAGSNMKSITTLYLKCKGIPNYTIMVNIMNDEISDTYMEQRLLLEYEKKVIDYYHEVLGDVKVICQPAYYPTAYLDQNITLDEYLSCGKYKISEHIIITSKEKINKIEKIIDFYREKSIPHESVYIKVLKDIDKINYINDYQSMRRMEKEIQNIYSDDQIYILNKSLEVIKKRGGYFQ